MVAALRFNDELGPPNPKFGSHLRPVSAPLRPEIHGTQNPDYYTGSQVVKCSKIRLFVVVNYKPANILCYVVQSSFSKKAPNSDCVYIYKKQYP